MAEQGHYRPHLPRPYCKPVSCPQASPLPLLHLAPLHPNCLLAGLPPPSGPSIAARVSFPRWKSEWVAQLKILLTALGYLLGWSPISPALQSHPSGPGADSCFISQAVERIAFFLLFQASSCLFTFIGVVPSAWGPSSYPSPANSHSSFPCGSAGKESACNVGDLGLIPGLGRSPGEWKGYPLQNSGLENSMDCIVTFHSSFGTQLDCHLLGILGDWPGSCGCHRNRFSLVHTNGRSGPQRPDAVTRERDTGHLGTLPKSVLPSLVTGVHVELLWACTPILALTASHPWWLDSRLLPRPCELLLKTQPGSAGPSGPAQCPTHSCPHTVDVAGVWGAVRSSETQRTERSGSCEGGPRPRQMDGKQAGKVLSVQGFLSREQGRRVVHSLGRCLTMSRKIRQENLPRSAGPPCRHNRNERVSHWDITWGPRTALFTRDPNWKEP